MRFRIHDPFTPVPDHMPNIDGVREHPCRLPQIVMQNGRRPGSVVACCALPFVRGPRLRNVPLIHVGNASRRPPVRVPFIDLSDPLRLFLIDLTPYGHDLRASIFVCFRRVMDQHRRIAVAAPPPQLFPFRACPANPRCVFSHRSSRKMSFIKPLKPDSALWPLLAVSTPSLTPTSRPPSTRTAVTLFGLHRVAA